MALRIAIRKIGKTFPIELKEELPLLKGVPVEKQQPIHSGKQRGDGRLLSDYGVKNKSFIYMLTRIWRGRPVDPWNEAGGVGDKRGKSRRMKVEVCFSTFVSLLTEPVCLVLWLKLQTNTTEAVVQFVLRGIFEGIIDLCGPEEQIQITTTFLSGYTGEHNHNLLCKLCQLKGAVEATDQHHKMVVRIFIRMLTGRKFPIELTDERFQRVTVEWLKEEIQFLEGTPVDKQRLIHAGKHMKDSRLLLDYGVKDGSIIHIITLKGGDGHDPGNEAGGMGDKSGENQSEHNLSCKQHQLKATDQHHKMDVRIIVTMFTGRNFIIQLTNERFQRATVEWLMEDIWFFIGIPVDYQRLLYDGKQMEDSRLLLDYGVQDESVINVVPRLPPGEYAYPRIKYCERGDKTGENRSGQNCNLHQLKGAAEATDQHHKMVVKIIICLLNRKIIIEMTDKQFQRATVLRLQEEIQFLEGIPVDQQRLIHDGKQMEDSRRLSDYGVEDESVIHVLVLEQGSRSGDPKKEDGGVGDVTGENQIGQNCNLHQLKGASEATDQQHKMVVRIFICVETGKKIPIELTDERFRRATAEWLKEEIQFLEGTPVNKQRLFRDGRDMDDSRLLSDYGVQDGSVIHSLLLLRGGGSVEMMKKFDVIGDKRGRNQSMENLSCF